MSTIADASRSKDDWTIHGVLVNKRLFVAVKDARRMVLLTLVLLDKDGVTIELQTWNPKKAYVVYGKVTQDKKYLIKGRGELYRPNAKFSSFGWQTRRWYIEETDYDFTINRHLPCSNDIAQVRSNLSKNSLTQNVVASYLGMHKGPNKYAGGRPTVRGWYIKLRDQKGIDFFVLVWHRPHQQYRFVLETAEFGETVLITSARESYQDSSNYTNENNYTLTTIDPPVLNSGCVAKSKLRELAKRTTNTKYEH